MQVHGLRVTALPTKFWRCSVIYASFGRLEVVEKLATILGVGARPSAGLAELLGWTDPMSVVAISVCGRIPERIGGPDGHRPQEAVGRFGLPGPDRFGRRSNLLPGRHDCA